MRIRQFTKVRRSTVPAGYSTLPLSSLVRESLTFQMYSTTYTNAGRATLYNKSRSVPWFDQHTIVFAILQRVRDVLEQE